MLSARQLQRGRGEHMRVLVGSDSLSAVSSSLVSCSRPPVPPQTRMGIPRRFSAFGVLRQVHVVTVPLGRDWESF